MVAVILIARDNFKFQHGVKYLGVILQGGLRIDRHLPEKENRAKLLFINWLDLEYMNEDTRQ